MIPPLQKTAKNPRLVFSSNSHRKTRKEVSPRCLFLSCLRSSQWLTSPPPFNPFTAIHSHILPANDPLKTWASALTSSPFTIPTTSPLFLLTALCLFVLIMSQVFTMDPSPPPFNPLQPSIPISYPLMTLEDLASRSYFKSFHYPYNKSSVPLNSSVLDSRPRVLVCHDMEGGYVDDKWVQGGTKQDAYAIWHWYLIDVFVYFSHNLVTLPPPCWTNTAHRHGVKVLGTFITESTKGREICNKLLSSKESAYMYAELLVELAVALGFDGWLLNFEVVLDVEQIPILKDFVSHLTQSMHSNVPGSLVIWYDSVTVDGNLGWQNRLNEKNKPFFDNCDGIFVNYTWQEDYPKLSAAVAGDRKYDVYMGIDVFGRSTYGGGQWKTNVALDLLKKDDVSAAIFAPGWVYETQQPPNFETAQNCWWSLVEKSWGIVKFYPKTLPFYSNFDQGHGYHVSVEGWTVSDAPWNNISSQTFQPILQFNADPTPDTIQVLVNFEEASYSGGGSIAFKGTLKNNTDFATRIFQGELLLGDLPLHLTYSVKSEENSLLGLSLNFSSTVNEKTSVLVASWAANDLSRKFTKVIMPQRVNKAEMAPEWVVQECTIEMNGYTLTEIHAVCYRPKPEHSGLVLYTSDGEDESLVHSPEEFFAVLGHLAIKTTKENPYFPPSSSWLVKGQHIKWSSDSQGSKTLSMEITWKLKDGNDSQFQKFYIYVEPKSKQGTGNPEGRLKGVWQYIGEANVEAFYISELPIPSSTSGLKFIIQVCGPDGSCQKLEDSPFFQLSVEVSVMAEERRIELCHCRTEKSNLRTSGICSVPERRFFGFDYNRRFDSLLCKRSKAVLKELSQMTSRLERKLQNPSSRQRKLLVFMILSWIVIGILLRKFNSYDKRKMLNLDLV